MNDTTTFRELLKHPAYRLKLAFFLILGFSVALLGVLLQSRYPFWSEMLLEFAVAFGAIGVLQFLWDFLGGEPVELRIEEVRQEIRDLKASVVPPLSDLMDGNIGIERIWPDRRTWQTDRADGLTVWHNRVCQGERVDIMSNTLWNNWMHQEKFRERLFNSTAHGTHVRILVYDPDSEILRLRARDEKDVPGEMQQEIKATLLRIVESWKDLPEAARPNIEVRLTTQTLHPVQIVRADERMIVAIYLSGKSGGPSPTLQLRGPGSSYFRKYAEQFEIFWQRACKLEGERLSALQSEYGHLPTPPVEGAERYDAPESA